jgi:SAM-dependent methyltransferase
MADTKAAIREHYSSAGLTDRIKVALNSMVPESQSLSADELAPLDQFHIRGTVATAELASAAGVESSTNVLDVGCGIGGPARSIAEAFGCRVTGVDLSPSFIDAAQYLTSRSGLSSRVTFKLGDALQLPIQDGAYDVVLLQHVAMNIQNRAALYGEVARVLRPGGKFGTYDLVLRKGDTAYPVPWARDASTSFLLSECDTRIAMEEAGFIPIVWRDDTQSALEWIKTTMVRPAQSGLNLGVVMGAEMREMAGNLSRNLREERLGVLFAVLRRD